MCVAFGVCVAALTPAVALADQNTIDVGASPIVRITLGSGTVNVRTWDRQAVRIDDTTDLDVKKSEVESSEAQSAIPVFAGRLPGASGVLELPPESFVVSTIPPGPRPLVSIRGHDTDVTVTVPKSAALVTVQLNKGNVSIQDYRSGTFVARVRFGNVRLDGVGGDGFVQVMRGPVIAHASSFDRLRVRTGSGNAVFDACHAKQIEVSSVNGTIVYDDGTFEPGLARFETQHGSIGIGVSGPADLGGHTTSGRMYDSFDRQAQVTDGGQHVVVGSGGPIVSAATTTGNVYFYDGALMARRVPEEWNPLKQVFHRGMTPHLLPDQPHDPLPAGQQPPRPNRRPVPAPATAAP